MSKYQPKQFFPNMRPEWAGVLSYIGTEEKAAIFQAVLEYPNHEPIDSKFWERTIKPDLDRQYEAYQARCEQNSQNRKTKDEEPTHQPSTKIKTTTPATEPQGERSSTNVNHRQPSSTNVDESEIEIEKEIEIENENEKESENEKEKEKEKEILKEKERQKEKANQVVQQVAKQLTRKGNKVSVGENHVWYPEPFRTWFMAQPEEPTITKWLAQNHPNKEVSQQLPITVLARMRKTTPEDIREQYENESVQHNTNESV